MAKFGAIWASAALSATLAVSACGILPQNDAEIPVGPQRDEGRSIFEVFANNDDPNTTIDVNKYIWNAAQEVDDYLAEADHEVARLCHAGRKTALQSLCEEEGTLTTFLADWKTSFENSTNEITEGRAQRKMDSPNVSDDALEISTLFEVNILEAPFHTGRGPSPVRCQIL